MAHELGVVVERSLVLVAVARGFGELRGRNDELFIRLVHHPVCILRPVVGQSHVRRCCKEVLLGRLHVRLGFSQPVICRTRSLVGRVGASIGVEAVCLRRGFSGIDCGSARDRVDRAGIRADLASVRGELALVGVGFARISGYAARIGFPLARVRRSTSSVCDELSLIRVGFSSGGGDAARVGVRASSVCRALSRVSVSVAGIRGHAASVRLLLTHVRSLAAGVGG